MSASPSPLPRVKNAAPCRGRCRAQLFATKERYRCGLPLAGTHRPASAILHRAIVFECRGGRLCPPAKGPLCVRRSLLHSVSAGAAKTPYPQPSSFPNCDRFTGSQFGHLEFYNAARDLDDGGQKAFYEYGLWGRRKVEVRPVNRKNRPGSSEPGRSFYRCVPRKKIDTTPGPVCAPMTGPT